MEVISKWGLITPITRHLSLAIGDKKTPSSIEDKSAGSFVSRGTSWVTQSHD